MYDFDLAVISQLYFSRSPIDSQTTYMLLTNSFISILNEIAVVAKQFKPQSRFEQNEYIKFL